MRRGVAGVWMVGVLLAATPLGAQEPAPAVPAPDSLVLEADTLVSPADTLAPALSPARAFLRGLVLPGWGHVAAGSYSRGGFYVAAQSGTVWMIAKSAFRRHQADRLLSLERQAATSRITASGSLPPDSVALRVDSDVAVLEIQELRDARRQQVEDWTALGIFLVLLSAVDAFVSAHLMDYPEPLSIEVNPGPSPGAVELRFALPLGGR